ncbi:MAG TPA: hypothetical protein VGQ09_14310 [Chitinophagaceae bacterium]|jgi:hypothetical protein|nr:hypothetical protein [Chitinophagaceae bacterium]
MKAISIILLVLLINACNNHGSTSKTEDTTSINMSTGNMSEGDGGPNNGLGDTNSYNRMNDTIIRDTVPKK